MLSRTLLSTALALSLPHGGAISGTPSQPGHCANLFAP
jgi:hypothetical protein